jgi:hypothetical protein
MSPSFTAYFINREDTRRNAKKQGNKKHLNKKFLEVQKGAGSPILLNMLLTVWLEPLLRAKSQELRAKSKFLAAGGKI